MTMFAFFALNSIFELMYHFRVPAMPPQLEYAAAAIAYSVEGLLFLWHLEGRPPMDVQVKIFIFSSKEFGFLSHRIKLSNLT
jgi:hypothetical protein